jgi:hypothetical protein
MHRESLSSMARESGLTASWMSLTMTAISSRARARRLKSTRSVLNHPAGLRLLMAFTICVRGL